MDNSTSYGYQNGYGAGASDADVAPSTATTYGYQNGYGSAEGSSQWDVAKTAMNQVAQTIPWNQVRQYTTQPLAQAISDAGNDAGYPKTGAAIGTAVAISPEILGAVTGLEGLYKSPSPTVQGLLNTPQELSPQYAAQNAAAGISNTVPETASKVVNPDPYSYPSTLTKPKYVNGIAGQVEGAPTIPRLKPQVAPEPLPSTTPLKYPDDPGTLINLINNRVNQFGQSLNPQELSDYKNLLQTKMGAGGDIPKFDQNGNMTSIWAQASQTNKNLTGALNQAVDQNINPANLPDGTLQSRGDLNQAYSTAKTQQNITDFVKKYGARAGELGAGAYGLDKVYNYFKK